MFQSIQNFLIMVDYFGRREDRKRVRTRPLSPSGEGRTDFAGLVPASHWAALPPAVRERFNHVFRPSRSVVYRGFVSEMQFSCTGWLLAQALRLLGAPLPFDRCQRGCAAVVTVTANRNGETDDRGQIWTRMYGRRTGFPHVVHSAKRFAGPTGLEEVLPGGLGMALTLSARDDALLFKSAFYFVTLFGRRFRLPTFLAPGTMVVGHHDRGRGTFAFTLDLTHPWLGSLIRQVALFHDMEEARP